MSKQRTIQPWAERLREVLDDGKWHEYGDVIEEAGKLVPDDLAWKKAEYYREYHYHKRGRTPTPRRYGTKEDTIKTGKRFIVAKAIETLVRHGEAEVLSEPGEPGHSRKRPIQIRSL